MSGLHPWWPAGIPVHPHLFFEALAYGVGFWRVWRERRLQGDALGTDGRLQVLVGGAVGGTLGSKALFVLIDPALWTSAPPSVWTGGKTIVGGLLGAWLGVEIAKALVGITRSTGDVFVRPLVVGMGIGRLGCFFSGVTDGTHGLPSALPWAMDLGDGVPRHPAALYELVLLGMLLPLGRWRPRIPGQRFRLFLGLYLLFRLFVEAVKTQPGWVGGLSAIQVACALGLLALGVQERRARRLHDTAGPLEP